MTRALLGQADEAVRGSASALEQALRESGFAVFPADSPTRPTILACHPDKGLVAIDVVHGSEGAKTELNRRVEQLRIDVPLLADVKVSRLVVNVGAASSKARVLAAKDALVGAWIADLPDRPLEPETESQLGMLISPKFSFESPRRGQLVDDGSDERAARRVTLDLAQAGIATRQIDGVLALSGPPGSGKTLVLAARARWLAELHPEWRIEVLCFNRLLVPYLISLVRGYANINVGTFGRFAAGLGFRIDLSDEAAAERDVTRALRDAYPCVDAYLVDESQDFFPSWITLLLATLMPKRGGLMLAGDENQALYRDSSPDEDLLGAHVQRMRLTRPYRSTRPILEVTSVLDPTFEVAGREQALEGEPVDLVWATNHREQANAVARDIRMLLDAGNRTPENIGVLYTRRFHLGALCHSLTGARIPYEVAKADTAGALSLASPTVKLITVHSSKGYEFDVVFLVGLEQLPSPDGTIEKERQGRTGYVGMTRARDQLVITYSKDNAYLEHIRGIPQTLLRRWVWPDDYPEE